ncbi:MAG: ribonuclease catalytic domain-containing protein [Mariprofundaceae bacterium]|nr:ribonuclease catalytic domain-containing protein [Mariprofundaceae bacterium]
MSGVVFSQGSLVVYKSQAASVVQVMDQKIEISFSGDKHKKVREKDIIFLHPGPVANLKVLEKKDGDMLQAWELLQGEESNLEELCDLAFSDFTPELAWATWEWLKEDLYFHGTVDCLTPYGEEELAEALAKIKEKLEAKHSWKEMLVRVASGSFIEEDRKHLKDVVELALDQRISSRVLQDLGQKQTMQNAHALLLKIAYWSDQYNPWPKRNQVNMQAPDYAIPALPNETRKDLTHMLAYAIDDEGCDDPDDAISVHDGRIWVHVADVAALVPANSEMDIEARKRSSNLYFPTEVVPMLPDEITHQLGLGLQDISPALTFSFKEDLTDFKVIPSLIKVQRVFYQDVEDQLGEEPFSTFQRIAVAFHKRRHEAGAVQLTFPESKIKVNAEQEVNITVLPRLKSRQLVTEFMLMTGEAVARFANHHQIPFAYNTQAEPEPFPPPQNLVDSYACRMKFKRGIKQTSPSPHSGLGMAMYVQITSPLRRYLDLCAHQQLRAFIVDKSLMNQQEIIERIGATQAATPTIRQTERLSNKHWTLMYFKQNPSWQGPGIVVDERMGVTTLIVPELAFETKVKLKENYSIGTELCLGEVGVDIANQNVRFGHVELLAEAISD